MNTIRLQKKNEKEKNSTGNEFLRKCGNCGLNKGVEVVNEKLLCCGACGAVLGEFP